MSDSTIVALNAKATTREIAAMLLANPATINVDSLAWFYRAAQHDQDAFLDVRDDLVAALRALPDDRKVAIKREQAQIDEEFEARRRPNRWVGEIIENSIFESLRERRMAAGVAKVSIPDPYIDITLEAKFAYEPDVDALELIARDLPSEDAAKLVTVIPEYTEPEHTVVVPAKHHPRQVFVGNTVSILAIMKRYAGSPIATAIDAAMGKKLASERLTIKPRPVATPEKTVVNA